MTRATADSWKTVPMPAARRSADVQRTYSAEQFANIEQGVIPHDQDDRWFIWTGTDHVVHIHRSWTGFELYRVHFAAGDGGYTVTQAEVNADPEQLNTDPRGDAIDIQGKLDTLARGSAPSGRGG